MTNDEWGMTNSGRPLTPTLSPKWVLKQLSLGRGEGDRLCGRHEDESEPESRTPLPVECMDSSCVFFGERLGEGSVNHFSHAMPFFSACVRSAFTIAVSSVSFLADSLRWVAT